MLIGAWKFVPVTGTCIEEKHGRVAHAVALRKIGAIGVSLANRLPLLERWIGQGHVDIVDLMDSFDLARKVKDIPGLLGFEDHPELQDLDSLTSQEARTKVTNIIYRCDLAHMFRSMKHEASAARKVNDKKKVIQTRLELEGSGKAPPLSAIAVKVDMMRDHFGQMGAKSGVDIMFSMPSRCLGIASLADALAAPSVNCRKNKKTNEDTEHFDTGGDVEAALADESGQVLFTIAVKNLGGKIVVPVSIGAGGRVGRHQVPINVYQEVVGNAGGVDGGCCVKAILS